MTAGLVVFGLDYAWLGLRRTAAGLRVSLRVCKEARNGTAEQEQAGADVASAPVVLRVQVAAGGRCHFSYSLGEGRFHDIGETFLARPGHWCGREGRPVRALGPGAGPAGHADVDWFRVTER
jgi:hypothetical protein